MTFYKSLFYVVLFSLGTTCFMNAQEGSVSIIQDPDIEKLLEFKKDLSTIKVYKIQVFQSVDPDLAQTEKSDFLDKFSQWPVSIEWNTPNYKVWVGNFATRLEADRALQKIKPQYMNAIIFQPKAEIKK